MQRRPIVSALKGGGGGDLRAGRSSLDGAINLRRLSSSAREHPKDPRKRTAVKLFDKLLGKEIGKADRR